MKQIKKLELDELKQIYKAHIREDFPRGERRPYASMEKMTNAGKYVSFGYYDDARLLAYACYILTENGMYALLDYFAVVPKLRAWNWQRIFAETGRYTSGKKRHFH